MTWACVMCNQISEKKYVKPKCCPHYYCINCIEQIQKKIIQKKSNFKCSFKSCQKYIIETLIYTVGKQQPKQYFNLQYNSTRQRLNNRNFRSKSKKKINQRIQQTQQNYTQQQSFKINQQQQKSQNINTQSLLTKLKYLQRQNEKLKNQNYGLKNLITKNNKQPNPQITVFQQIKPKETIQISLKQMIKIGKQQANEQRTRLTQIQNRKLTIWLDQMTQILKRILKNNKLNDVKQFMQIPSIKTAIYFYKEDDFPYKEIMSQFQLIVNKALFIMSQYNQERIQKLNHQLARIIINELRIRKNAAVQQFSSAAEKRQKIAIEYETLAEYDMDILLSLRSQKLQTLLEHKLKPNLIVDQIQNEIKDLQKHREFLQQNFKSQQPHSLLKRRIQLHEHFQKKLQLLRQQNSNKSNKKMRQEAIKQLIQKQKFDYMKKHQKVNQTEKQKKQRQFKWVMDQSRKIVAKMMTKKPFQQQYQQLQKQMASKQSIGDLIQFFKTYKPSFLQGYQSIVPKMEIQE